MNYTLEQLKEMMDRNGGSLYLSGTSITALPEGLTVGGSLDLEGCTSITNPRNYKKLQDGDYVPKKYLYADGILTHVSRVKTIGKYTYYCGKIKHKNVISDGTNFAHCRSFKDGVADLEFKAAKERGAEQYKHLTLDSVLNPEEAKTMYRIITGACRAGTEHFVSSLGEIKEQYTVRELVEMTRGQYGSERFRAFFKEES